MQLLPGYTSYIIYILARTFSSPHMALTAQKLKPLKIRPIACFMCQIFAGKQVVGYTLMMEHLFGSFSHSGRAGSSRTLIEIE